MHDRNSNLIEVQIRTIGAKPPTYLMHSTSVGSRARIPFRLEMFNSTRWRISAETTLKFGRETGVSPGTSGFFRRVAPSGNSREEFDFPIVLRFQIVNTGFVDLCLLERMSCARCLNPCHSSDNTGRVARTYLPFRRCAQPFAYPSPNRNLID
jgi:hypothetical protein